MLTPRRFITLGILLGLIGALILNIATTEKSDASAVGVTSAAGDDCRSDGCRSDGCRNLIPNRR